MALLANRTDLFALCNSRYGVELLPDEYTLRLEPGIDGRCFRHYNGAIPAHNVQRRDSGVWRSKGFLITRLKEALDRVLSTADRVSFTAFPMTDILNVVFAPDCRNGVPYQELLATALDRHNVNVRIYSGSWITNTGRAYWAPEVAFVSSTPNSPPSGCSRTRSRPNPSVPPGSCCGYF
jgi:hypothetical protein